MKKSEFDTCTVENCDKKFHARGMCGGHYSRWAKTGVMGGKLQGRDPSRGCSFEGCENPYRCGGYCHAHYEMKRKGKELVPTFKMRVYASDEEKFRDSYLVTDTGCWQWKWSLGSMGYGSITVSGRGQILAHRYSYETFKGAIPDGLEIDHQCRNRGCVNPDHLKAVTKKQNRENLGLSPRNSSGYRGVYRAKGKWVTYVTHNKKRYSAGAFDDLEEAAEAIRLLRIELFTNNVEDRS